jgi:hypothetical protein
MQHQQMIHLLQSGRVGVFYLTSALSFHPYVNHTLTPTCDLDT